jgi:enamine deaminase RidA (YjgF/YER057c/UK114 family)
MDPKARLEKNFAAAIVQMMDRSYFPSTLLWVETENPRVRGIDRDWQVFLHGVENGAKASLGRIQPTVERAEDTFVRCFKHLETALAKSDDLSVEALEDLLAARNVITEYTQYAWKNFYNALKDWASGVLGLHVDRLGAGTAVETASLAAVLLGILHQGAYHPFFGWALATYKDNQDIHISDLREVTVKYLRTPPTDREMLDLLEAMNVQTAVGQYLKWARLEYKEVKDKVVQKSQGMTLPNAELSEWIAAELFNEGEDDDDE